MSRLIFIFCIFFAFTACSSKKEQTVSKPLLLVSIPPYQTLVQKLAGESFEVRAIAHEQADPHSYEPTSSQVSQILEGKVWFQIGESFEKKISPLLQSTHCLRLTEGASLIENDRHLWLSPKEMGAQARVIAKTLEEHFPQEKEKIEERLLAVQQELETLDKSIQAALEKASSKSFIVSHPAFAYFCRDYGCEQLSIEQEGKEPRPQEVEEVALLAQKLKPEVAIALPQHNNKGAQVLAEQLHIPVRVINPYDHDYSQTMQTLAAYLVDPWLAQE